MDTTRGLPWRSLEVRRRPDGGRPAARAATAARARAVGHSFGELRVIDGSTCELAPARSSAWSAHPGCGKSTLLELVAGLREPSAGTIAVGEATSPPERLARCAYMPQRDLLLPWLSRARQRLARAPQPRRSRAAGAPGGAAPLFERFGLAGFEERAPGASSRAGCASGSPSCARCSPASPCCCSTSRSPRSTRSPAAEMQEWLAGALDAEPRTVLLVTHDVEEALYLCRPGRRALAAAPGGGLAAPSAGAAGGRPRRRRHLARVRRGARAGARLRSRGARGERRALGSALAPLVVVALLGAWELAAPLGRARRRCSAIEPFLIPAPSEIAEALWDDRSLLAEDAWVTLREVVLGFALALVAGVALRVGCCTSPRPLRRAVYPLLVASQTIPIIVDRADPRRLVRLRDRAEAGDHRADLLLPDHGQHARRPALGRSGAGEDDAHAGRRPAADAAPGRGALGAALRASAAPRSRSRWR